MQKITPFLWFDTQAEEAATFYCSVFKHSKINHVARYGDAGPGPRGTVMLVDFELNGQRVLALNAGPQFKFTEAISLYVECENQAEVDELWSRLTTGGGQESQCGWLKDKYGLSWQIIPRALTRFINDKDPGKSQRVMQAMLKMKKIDLKELEHAYQET